MRDLILTIVLAIIGSNGLFVFVQFMINRHDGKKGRMAHIESQLKSINEKLIKSERDTLRTQLLLMLSTYPEQKAEIMTLAKHYFADLDGDWYMTGLFNAFIEREGLNPEWFDKTK